MADMNLTRTKIAAAGTTAALGTLAVVALSAGAQEQPKTAAAPKAPVAEVHTVVVHRTIRVVKHQRRKGHTPAAVAAPSSTAPRVVPVAVVQPAAPATQPVTTTHRERERELGDDQGQGVEPGDDNGQGVEPGDDNGHGAEAGDDNGGHNETADDRGGDSGHGSQDD